MKHLIYPLLLFVAMPLLLASCSDDMEGVEETVQVTFRAEIPGNIMTRAEAEGGEADNSAEVATSTYPVNQLVCAVFENGTEIGALRQTIDLSKVTGENIEYSPALIKGRSYQIAFWACDKDAYNVTDMKNITRVAQCDAFTATASTGTVTGAFTQQVTLTRPFAQLNMGVTEADWNAVKTGFELEPSSTTVTVSNCYNVYNAVEGKGVGEPNTQTYTCTSTGSDLVVGETTYKSLFMDYLLVANDSETHTVTYTIKAEGVAINGSNGLAISNVPLKTNCKTNIVGTLMTGTAEYTITISEGFSADSNTVKVPAETNTDNQ